MPTLESVSQICLNMFTVLTACPPSELYNQRRSGSKHKRKVREVKAQKVELLDKLIESGVLNGLPKRSAKRVNLFMRNFLTTHLDANKASDVIYASNYTDEIKRLELFSGDGAMHKSTQVSAQGDGWRLSV